MDRKEQLTAAARSVVAQLALRKLSLAAFSRETGIQPSTVYRHVDSWPALCAGADAGGAVGAPVKAPRDQ